MFKPDELIERTCKVLIDGKEIVIGYAYSVDHDTNVSFYREEYVDMTNVMEYCPEFKK